MVSVDALGQRVVILGSLEAIQDLLEKRGGRYSDRPRTVVGEEYIGYAQGMGLFPYNAQLKQARRMVAQAIGTKALVNSYAPLMSRTVQDFALNVLNSPEDFCDHIRL